LVGMMFKELRKTVMGSAGRPTKLAPVLEVWALRGGPLDLHHPAPGRCRQLA
jgi:hypothetical protein